MTTKKPTRCLYCNLTLRGKGCPFSPSKVHIHPTPDRCIYCGLTLRGTGCSYSPSGVHMRFVDFGAIQGEQTQNHLMLTYLIDKLNVPFTDTPAYECGIIDENGHQVKTPETVMEERCFTPLDKYIFRLKRAFGDKLESINTEMMLEQTFKYERAQEMVSEDFDPDEYIKQTDIQSELKINLARIVSEYYNCIRNAAMQGVDTPKMERILLQVLTEHADKE